MSGIEVERDYVTREYHLRVVEAQGAEVAALRTQLAELEAAGDALRQQLAAQMLESGHRTEAVLACPAIVDWRRARGLEP